MNSNWTGRTPRDLTSAFGPYTSRDIYTEHTPMHKDDKIVLAACYIVIAIGVLAAIFVPNF